MELEFSKMHGLGNDFVVIDGISQTLPESGPPVSADRLRRLADRNFGIGFDQLLLVQPGPDADVDFRYRIFNSDGSEVNQCGNGARCFARFVRNRGLTSKHDIRVATAAGIIELHVTDDDQVTVNMGEPRWRPAEIPFNADQESDTYILVAGGQGYEVSSVGLGNPHCVLLVGSIAQAPVATVGPLLESHEEFPERVNVGFMEIIDRSHVRLRVFERGAGETLACGSGACAAVVCGQRRGLLDEHVTVDLPGGSLRISYSGNGGILMTGPAAHVYDGRFSVEE